MKAMIFAAGLGTRLQPFTDKHPKALAIVNGRTLLAHNILYLQRFGIKEVVVNVHHFADQIIQHLKDNDSFGSKIHISDEQAEVLETGGGLLKAAPFFQDESFVVMNVDMLTNLDLDLLIAAHNQGEFVATLAVMQRPSSRQLLFDNDMQLCGWQNKSTNETKQARATFATTEYAFSGIQIVHTSFYKHLHHKGKFSIIDAYLDIAESQAIKGYDHTGDLILDVGKPESLLLAAQLFH